MEKCLSEQKGGSQGHLELGGLCLRPRVWGPCWDSQVPKWQRHIRAWEVNGQLQRVGRCRCGHTQPQESWLLWLSLVTPLGGAPLPLALRTFSRHFQHWCYGLVPVLVNEITCPSGPQAPCPPGPWAFHLESLRFSLEVTSAWRSWCAGDLPQNAG